MRKIYSFHTVKPAQQSLTINIDLMIMRKQTNKLQVLCLVMRPSSLGGGRILRRTLSVRLSVRPSRYPYRASRRAT